MTKPKVNHGLDTRTVETELALLPPPPPFSVSHFQLGVGGGGVVIMTKPKLNHGLDTRTLAIIATHDLPFP